MKPLLKWLLVMLLLGAATLAFGAFLMTRTHAVTVIKSSAQSWVWVAPDRQHQFVAELRDYARMKGLKFNPSEQPGPGWTMIGIIMVTPKENELSIINATAPDKFAAAITIFHPEPGWQNYWKDFRAYVRARHKWEEIP